MDIPKSHYVYEFSYPEEMPELAGIIFYVGKGTSLSRMNDHFREAANEKCDCAKCEAIRSVWAAGFVVVRNIVFTSGSEKATLEEENRCIINRRSPYLTNIQYNRPRPSKPLWPKMPSLASSQDAIGYVSAQWEAFYQNSQQADKAVSGQDTLNAFFHSLTPDMWRQYGAELAALECTAFLGGCEGLLEPA